MSAGRGIFKNVIVAILLLGFIAISVNVALQQKRDLRCTKLSINILDSAKTNFVRPKTIDSLIFGIWGNVKGRKITSDDIYAIENLVESQMFVEWSDVFYNSKGEISVNLTQREPIMRIITETGYDFYVDSALYVLKPTPDWNKTVPIISGKPAFTFDTDFYGFVDEKKAPKDAAYIKKLINFVQFISKDDFLRDFIMQIYIANDGKSEQVSIMPRIGQQVVVIGELSDFENKLLKTKAFYLQCYGSADIDSITQVDVSYSGQIITR